LRHFDVNSVTLPRWNRLLKALAERRFPREQPPDPGLATETNQR
jgi:hypothetical protein